MAGPLWAEWEASQPDVPDRLRRAAAGSAPKAWRFAGEMDEIARTLADVGLPDGFHRAAAELYRNLEPFKDATSPELDAVTEALVQAATAGGGAAMTTAAGGRPLPPARWPASRSST
ncbi:MAG: DUF1932 domain-containing protein [Acidimicrobiales bacterium]